MSDEAPTLKFAVLKNLCVAGNTNYLEESAQLSEELGIDRISGDALDVDDLVARLMANSRMGLERAPERLPSFEELARRSHEVFDKVVDGAEFLWRQWVALQPARLSAGS